MNRPSLLRIFALVSCAGLNGAVATRAQSIAPKLAPAPTAEPAEEAVQLAAFEVNAKDDTGYASSSAMNATRTNEKLENLPNSISVMTQDFLQDLGITDLFGAVDFAVGAENIYNGQGTVGAPVNTRGGNQISFRGFASVRQLRDGFPWYLSTDSYNTERIEFSRGPGGLAYGDVDPGGIVNVSTKRANARALTTLNLRYDTFYSRRASLDVNRQLFKDRVMFRVNAVDSRMNTSVQRKGNSLRAIGGAARIVPFEHKRTQLDLTYEAGHSNLRLGHLPLIDHTLAYVRGTGTTTLDANPTLTGVQPNGIGMRRIGTGNVKSFAAIDGQLFNLVTTATAAYRNSAVVIGAAATAATDPQNPTYIPFQPISEAIVPRGQDWGGPDNRQEAGYHAYTVELKHAFTDKFSVLVANNGQLDDTWRLQAYSAANLFGTTSGVNSRSVLIDVNPTLPSPTGTGTITNPNFEKLFIAHTPIKNRDSHNVQNWRGAAVYDFTLPWWDISQRVVGSSSYRREKYRTDYYLFAITQEEIARRGFTGAAATYVNNLVYPVHYLAAGNSDEALRIPEQAGLTTFYRANAGNNQRFDQTLASQSVTLLGKYFKEKLTTSIGVSRDYWRQNKALTPVTNALTGQFEFVDRAGVRYNSEPNPNVPLYAFSRQWATNQSFGGVYRLLTWLSLSGGYFESTLFSDNTTVAINGEPGKPRAGEGKDFSARFHFLDDRVRAKITYFETVSENNTVVVDAGVLTELNALLTPAGGPSAIPNNGDFRDQRSQGYEVELLTNLTRNWTLRATYSENRVQFTRFLPLLRPYLAHARTAATTQGLNPDTATQLTQAFILDQEGNIALTRRRTANLTTRYGFTEGKLKGLSLGTSARYISGHDLPATVVADRTLAAASKSENVSLLNPFASYRLRFSKVTTTFQVNIDNLFDNRSAQGNNRQLPRYLEPRQFTFQTTFAFGFGRGAAN